ncbi:hypothetical protein EV426DRAFT_715602 [Tirmania nivea]|nr:hypothetical protein EV426DRAFT_715602 [Tirmania nivea]
MSNYVHPAQGYYGRPPSPPRTYNPYNSYPPTAHNNPNNPNTYDLAPRNTPFIPMPPPPRRPLANPSDFIHRYQSLLWSLFFWLIFLLIDLFVHHFPKYPYSADRHYHSRAHVVVVVYTFVFQLVWLVGVGGKTVWDLGWELRRWWSMDGGTKVKKILGIGVGLLGCIILVGWPALALGFNATVLAERNRRG